MENAPGTVTEEPLLRDRTRQGRNPKSTGRPSTETAKVSAPAMMRQDINYGMEYLDNNPNVETWLDDIIQEALRLDGSDILLNTSADGQILTCDVRVDGRMRPLRRVEGSEAQRILGRFKAQAGLATSGTFAPEETVHLVPVDGEQRKARVAAFRRSDNGSAVVMRLPPKGDLKQLEELSFSEHNLELVHKLLGSANRMVMLAGPMGSGKTTTAHGALGFVANGERTVWTIEDPVERNIPGLVQLEVDEENGAGFDALLPALVRSDYDTLFLGEIRDYATAAAGVRQAKAGRQVITTIHANDNVTALLRLIELAKDSPLSVLDSVRGVISQRLVGKLNPHWDGADPKTKYRGRVPIHEVLEVDEELIQAMMEGRPLGEIRAISFDKSFSTFKADAERLIYEGVTDKEEIERVLGKDA